MAVVIGVIIGVAAVALVLAASSLRLVQQYERGVVFRLGRVLGPPRQPGLALLIPGIDRMQKVNMQIFTLDVPGQDCITRDNVSVRVDAVVYFRVIDPVKAVVNVQNYAFAVSQVAQTSLRSVIGKADLDTLLSERDRVNAELKEIIEEPTEGPWGVRVERVEVKDVVLPETMKRSMSHQAEAERDRRARVITADGEYQASKRLSEAARTMSSEPGSLQLRLLQTVVDVASERNSTLVMPVPVELLRFFETSAEATASSGTGAGQQAGQPASGQDGSQQPESAREQPEHTPDQPQVQPVPETADVSEFGQQGEQRPSEGAGEDTPVPELNAQRTDQGSARRRSRSRQRRASGNKSPTGDDGQ